MKEIFKTSDIQQAYKKLKTYIYYDNFNLHLRYSIACFEFEDIDIKLQNVCDVLNQLCSGISVPCIDDWIKSSGYIILPKSFNSDNRENPEEDQAFMLTNKVLQASFDVSKITVLYDAPVELFIIATLWCDKISKYIEISKDSYGYVTPRYRNSNLLYEPYFKKYQEWRDKGIKTAKQQIEIGNNVLIVSLDIKNFFHSVKVDFAALKDCIDNDDISTLSLTSIIEQISIDHTNKVFGQCDKLILPIGLPSSGIIANWVMSDFDRDIKHSVAPVYYGRYVDDMLLVIANVEPDMNNVTDWLCQRFFSDGNVLKKDDKGNLELTSSKCKGLQIQQSKLRLFYFDSNWSLALLNKFQSTLLENSSAFWFLPNEEDLKDSLDDTYDLQYEDTINKFRSISSCKVNKYGASVFLAKRLKLAILSPGQHDNKLRDEIFRFFNGLSIVSMYSMWEKVFTYFAIIRDYTSIKKLQDLILVGISNTSVKQKDKIYEFDDIDSALRRQLELHMQICMMLARVFVKDNIGKSNIKSIITEGAYKFKRTLLTRHFYLPLPIFALTNEFVEKEADMADFNISTINNNEIRRDLKDKNWLIPRHIGLHEICTLNIHNVLCEQFSFIYKFKDEKPNTFLSICKSLYEDLNGETLDSVIKYSKHKVYTEKIKHERKTKLYSEVINVKSPQDWDKIRIGISNVHTDSNDVSAAILNKSILGAKKRLRHINILNKAEEIQADLLLLPEVFVPFDWLCAYADEARRKQRAMIFGLEHFTIKNICYNIAITLLPFEHHGRKEVLIVPRIKNHYSPKETVYIEGNRKRIPIQKYSVYHLFQWRGIQFSVYNCYELTDIVHRSIFRSELDVLFAIEYNSDVNYFSNISESVSRDLHCYYVQANTSDYGDSRVIEPKKTQYQNPVRVKGGDNDVILSYELNIASLRKFQNQTYSLQVGNKEFKMTPPDFQHDKVEQRGKS